MDGNLPERVQVDGNLPFNLQKTEKVIWVFHDVDYYEQKLVMSESLKEWASGLPKGYIIESEHSKARECKLQRRYMLILDY